MIHGDADPIVKPDAGKEVAATIPGSDLCIVKGMGHDISMKFVDIIADCIVKNASKIK